jgi:hypothetical protein
MLSQSDIYIGYGRALTGDVWYKDILRAELRLRLAAKRDRVIGRCSRGR